MEITYKHEISVEAYNFLRKSVGWAEIEKSQAQTGLDNTNYLITAMHNSNAIGMVRIITDGGYIVMIADVIVHPKYQGNGVGKHLMESVMQHIHSNLREGQSVFVNLMAVKGKELFYEKFGFETRPNDDLGAGMTQFINK